ncbi:MAG: hypothetical protein QXL94_02945 [Candidatus Parvarchaeum sp.]
MDTNTVVSNRTKAEINLISLQLENIRAEALNIGVSFKPVIIPPTLDVPALTRLLKEVELGIAYYEHIRDLIDCFAAIESAKIENEGRQERMDLVRLVAPTFIIMSTIFFVAWSCRFDK